MIPKNEFGLSYDPSGNVIITIPRSYIQRTDRNMLLKALEDLVRSAMSDNPPSVDWTGDSALNVVGICDSETGDGSLRHDDFLYGRER